ncbi:polysaccharide deacetylase family protein [Candidatus Thioglobus sp.]|nr:polysaccharide deacetylase family protein [Candidatus Thioglobus sp.]
MSFKHYLLTAGYQPLRIYNFILKKLGKRPSARLRVLLYHDIAPQHEAYFKSQLCWLSKSWQFVTPHQFTEILEGALPLERDSLLLTFDDGFISNRGVAERILNPLKIKSVFFIVSNFSKLSKGNDWRRFVAQHIDPGLRPEDVPVSKQNMSIDDLKFLNNTGHSIGAHTADHIRLSDALDDGLNREIVDSADYLEQKLGIKIEHFAYTFGDLSSFTPQALAIARRRFKYIHTGLRGDNSLKTPPWAIRRDSSSPTDPLYLLGALLEGGADRLYLSSLNEYESWLGDD